MYFGPFGSTETVVYAGVWTSLASHPLNESNLSTTFSGRYCVNSFPTQKSSALLLSVLLRHEHVCGTAARGASHALRGQELCCVIREPWSPTAPALVPQGSAPRWLCLWTSIGPSRTGFAFALFCQMGVTATEKMQREDFLACHPSRKRNGKKENEKGE